MDIKNLLMMAVLAILPFVSCRQAVEEDTLRTGDLVFVGLPMDYSIEDGSMDEAISSLAFWSLAAASALTLSM